MYFTHISTKNDRYTAKSAKNKHSTGNSAYALNFNENANNSLHHCTPSLEGLICVTNKIDSVSCVFPPL